MVIKKIKIKIHFKKILSPDIATDFSTEIDLNVYLAIKNNFTVFFFFFFFFFLILFVI